MLLSYYGTKLNAMKTTNSKPVSQGKNNIPVQNKDDLDSRESEEQHVKGDHITHNKKDKKNLNRTSKNQ